MTACEPTYGDARPSTGGEDSDVIVVGGGAVGLAAGTRTAAAGLRTTLVERGRLGGAVRLLPRIELVAGYPVGLTGTEFVERSAAVARRYGVRVVVGEAVSVTRTDRGFELLLADGRREVAPAVLAASGVERSPPPLPGIGDLLGSGAHLTVASAVAAAAGAAEAVVMGEPEDAAVAALRLRGLCPSVTLLLGEGERLPPKLLRELRTQEDITVLRGVEVVCLAGVGRLEAIVLCSPRTARIRALTADLLVIVTAASPRAEWLPTALPRDAAGFPVCGDRPGTEDRRSFARPPDPNESGLPGLYVAGELRSGGPVGTAAVADAIAAARQIERRLLGAAATPLHLQEER